MHPWCHNFVNNVYVILVNDRRGRQKKQRVKNLNFCSRSTFHFIHKVQSCLLGLGLQVAILAAISEGIY